MVKLFRVTCCGMQLSVRSRPHGITFVVAKDAAAAYDAVRKRLDECGLGFPYERELSSVELVADGSDSSRLPALIFGS